MEEFLSQYINLTWIYWFLTVAYGLTVLSIICVIVSENRNPVKTLAWITVLLALPALGIILYFVFGRNIKNKHSIPRRNLKRLHRLEGRQTLKKHLKKLQPQSRHLAKLAMSLGNARIYEGNAATLYNNGADKFAQLLQDLAGARQYINLQYYIIADDKIGNRLKEVLCERARAGVKVRVIYDHVGSFRTKKKYFKEMQQAGIEVYPFFKVRSPIFGSRINWRNHRKIVVIDGIIGYIGGMNIADRYIDGGKFGLWRDMHMRVTGPAVKGLQSAFAIDWAFMGNDLIEDAYEHNGDSQGDIYAQVLTGGPTYQWDNMTLMFTKAISLARKRIFMMTPYFIPNDALLRSLQSAALSGVDVRIMMPEKSDSDMLRFASFSFIKECLQAGIKIYLFQPGMLHSKTIIIDDDIATVGSANLDFRSVEHNFEGNLLLYSTNLNKQLSDLFMQDLEQSRRITPREWRRRSILQRGLESFFRIFSPIL